MSAQDILSMVHDPDNSISMETGDLVTLREAGVPEGGEQLLTDRPQMPGGR